MNYKRTIALDFDGVLHEYHGWNEGALNEPRAGALDAVQLLLKSDCDLVIFTTRSPGIVKDWLKRHNFPEIRISERKPIAHAYLDDRGVRFNGAWTKRLLDDLVNLKAYWEIELDQIT